jgi:hypothetical protein
VGRRTAGRRNSYEGAALAERHPERLIQYDAQPNYANWGGITAYFHRTYGVRVPPDMKGSGPR